MNNFEELTEKQMVNIDGGGKAMKVLPFAENIYDFAKGAFQGFKDTAKKLPR
ncbi:MULTISPECIES: lactococcin G-beta/enterocin 1071B family bacteriocin [Clostridium]|uniref:lactococcin G-beta/enterocin 1071B family bacteriocin n=1 Tax=Clostridium TaxID=1485 RepID=UPI00207A022A|nr:MULTISPECIES: lactococcin G-beta/enterocin 1071B family bacteriocin [Clostridium]